MRMNGHYSKTVNVTFSVHVHFEDGSVECIATGISPDEALKVASTVYMHHKRRPTKITIYDDKDQLYAEWDRTRGNQPGKKG